MTDIELIAAIAVFLVCSLCIAWILGGGADTEGLGAKGATASLPNAVPDMTGGAVAPVAATSLTSNVPASTKTTVAGSLVKLEFAAPKPLAVASTNVTSQHRTSGTPYAPASALLDAASVPMPMKAADTAPMAPQPDAIAIAQPAAPIVPVSYPIAARPATAPQPPVPLALYALRAAAAHATTSVKRPGAVTLAPTPAADTTAGSAAKQQTIAVPSVEATHVAISPAKTTGNSHYLVSTASRGARRTGADAAHDDAVDLWREAPPRPRMPSIWSKSKRRVSPSTGELAALTLLLGQQSVQAERRPMRAETLIAENKIESTRRILGAVAFAAPDDAQALRLPTPSLEAATVAPVSQPNAIEVETLNPAPSKFSRIRHTPKLVGKTKLQAELKSTTMAATKVLGSEPAALKSRLSETRKERRQRTISAPVRKLYLGAPDNMSDAVSAPV